MSDKQYQDSRPAIPAELKRAVSVESGHACAVTRCGEHTYLEFHHINHNREDNRVENLILLCDRHHKMAHADVIDRKALSEYKRLLKTSYDRTLLERLERLEHLLAESPKNGVPSEPVEIPNHDPGLAIKVTVPGSQLSYAVIEELALVKFEREKHLVLDRQPLITKGTARLQLDAIRQDDDLEEDIIVEVRWLRKRYLDSPIWVRQISEATAAYEYITGRKAKGVLLLVVPKTEMKDISTLHYTSKELDNVERKPEVVIYTYSELGFVPRAVTADLFASNLKVAPTKDTSDL